MVRGHGGDIKYSYTIINAIAAKLPEQAIENIQKNPRVTYVEMDVEVHTLEDTLPWGVDRIDAELVWNGAEDGCDVIGGRNAGNGVNVAIIDTGIDKDHPDLSVAGGINYVVGSPFDDKYNDNWDDDNGHGTHCAGIVAALDNGIGVIGVAPKASLYAVKVLGSNGRGWTSDVIAGIQWSRDNGMQVISMSLAGGYSESMETACSEADGAGIVVVAAAGNSGPGDNTVKYPAKYESVIAVSATDGTGAIASFSSRGPEVELAAPGVSIYSTYRGGGYATMHGTSMACPHVAGTAALVIASESLSNDEVRLRLQQTADDLGRNTGYGHGLIDADEAAPPAGNQPPIADAGADQTVSDADGNSVEAVTLDGSGSSDLDGSIDTYEWKEGTTLLSTAESFTDNFSVGTHTVTLTVTDDGGASSSDDVIVTVNANQAPVADAGAGQTVSDVDGNGTEAVTLDGSGSSDPDPDGSIASYEWKEGETSLSTAVSFTRDFSVGTHTVTLTVTDDGGASSSDDVIVTVTEAPANTMHVASIEMSTTKYKAKGRFTYATATVTIVDADGNPVENAKVSGTWSGLTDDSDSGLTDVTGQVALKSDSVKNAHGTFTFTVTGVECDGWTYEPDANQETIASIKV